MSYIIFHIYGYFVIFDRHNCDGYLRVLKRRFVARHCLFVWLFETLPTVSTSTIHL